MTKQDVTMHSDDELSLIVMNDEFFYTQRHDRGFLSLVSESFIYTSEQLDVLTQDLEDDLAESES